MKPERIQTTYAYYRGAGESVVQVGKRRPVFGPDRRLIELPAAACLELACRADFIALADADLTGVDEPAVETVSPSGSDQTLVALTPPTIAALTAADDVASAPTTKPSKKGGK